ncbi:tyrosine-type recombinase/integrase [Rummeliibacillus pycnus]|uniref:tyrosine-type recombinase/integrase n=1 Tax=Rummeliibacillus pycnus TaxID=101070 RepID=UPI0037C7D891
MLKSIFSKAVKWGVIKDNPMKNVDEPKDKVRHRGMKFYDENQIKQLLATLENVDMKFRISVKLALFVGLLMAEIGGIRIDCLNFDDNTILINKTLQYDKDFKKYFLGPTKNKKSRIVSVPSTFMKELKLYAEKQEKLKEVHGTEWNPLLNQEGNKIDLLISRDDGFSNYSHNL